MATLALGVFKDLTPAAFALLPLGRVKAQFGNVSVQMDASEAEQLAQQLQTAANQLRAAQQGAAA